MGIQGLSTYLRENRRLLAKSHEFSSTTDGPSTPVVVDAWGFIYNLHYNSHLPWVYGGEYQPFCELVRTVVMSLVDVGLKLYFVFDGPHPRLKFDTMVNRLVQSMIQPSLLFFRTSQSSRATPRFLRESCSVIPPRLYTACVHALQDLARSTDKIEIHFADEEADAYAVELAGRVGGYVLSLDSDFAVFNAENYLGYIPLDEIVWNAHIERESESESEASDDFQVVKRSKEKSGNRTHSRGIVPPEVTSGLTLSVEIYKPSTLASHLNIPVSLLPLLGAFVGNDYSKQMNVRSRFFERQWTFSQRIKHIASTFQSVLNLSPQKRRQKQVGSVMELITRTVGILLNRSVTAMGPVQVQEIIDGIVVAALQYTITKVDQPQPELWPTEICVLHEPDVCPILPIFSRRIAQLASLVGEDSEDVAQRDIVRRLYLTAYRKGELSPLVVDILNTGSYWPKFFLENPDTGPVSVYIGRQIRLWGYSILDDAVGLPDAADAEEESEADEVDQEPDDDDELIDVVENSGDEDVLAPLRGELKRLHGPEADDLEPSRSTSSTSHSQPNRPTQPKIVTEYVRRGTRAAPDPVVVPPLATLLSSVPDFDEEDPTPLQLRSEEERLKILLCAFNSDTALVKQLSYAQLTVALALRWVLQCNHSRAKESGEKKEKERWTKYEAESFLASFSWSELPPEDVADAATTVVPIENRNIQLMAQILMALESIEHLSQILLLSERVPTPIHLFSGRRCHSYWTGVNHLGQDAIPPGLWEACTEGLEKGSFVEIKSRNGKKGKGRLEASTRSKTVMGINREGRGLFGLLDNVEA